MADNIVLYPAPILRQHCKEILVFDPEIAHLAVWLRTETAQTGRLGVAAPQVGLPLRAFACYQGKQVKFFANPVLDCIGVQSESRIEGCLSLPGRRFEVERWDVVAIRAYDEHGKQFSVQVSGLDARVLQHEFDHLQGTLIIDRVAEMLPHLPRQRRRAMERELAKVQG